MHSRNIRALVLKNIFYKDKDRIYTLFTRSEGRISVIARGVTKISSRRAGSLDSLNEVEAQVSDHISGQIYLNEVKVLKNFQYIKNDYDKLSKALYVAELINKLILEDGDNQHVYDFVIALFKKMNLPNYVVDTVLLNKFELKFMQMLGYEPPKSILVYWKKEITIGDYLSADAVVKKFIKDIVGENLKSLEL